MEAKTNDYHISFFRPTTPRSVLNRNMVIWLFCIWAVAIFGFQILLKVLGKPTPEPTYVAYEAVWDDINAGTADQTALLQFADATLSLLGKVFLSADEINVLDNALNWSFYQLLNEEQKALILPKIDEFNVLKAEVQRLDDENYINRRNELVSLTASVLQLNNGDLKAKFIPFHLKTDQMNEFSAANMEALPALMKKYLVHNQSFLTDAKFLGFPFHYFYTAVFLLILFVFLCWLYCVNADKLNKKFEVADV